MPAECTSTRPKMIPFNSLAKHVEKQVRGQTNAATVNSYARAMRSGASFPPLTVVNVGGSLILVDGFHRRAAYEKNGEWQAPCEIKECESLEQALWLAFNANMRHGLPLKSKAKRDAFRAYVEAGNHRVKGGGVQTYRDIAAAIPGSTHVSIWRWMQKDFPALFVEMSGGGEDAPGGLRTSHKDFPDPPYDLTKKAIELLDDAQALMDGVDIPEFRQRVAERAHMLSVSLAIWGVGTVCDDTTAKDS